MRRHFRSRDKDGDHTVQTAMDETPCCMQTWLCFTEPELLLMKVLHCGNMDFLPILFL